MADNLTEEQIQDVQNAFLLLGLKDEKGEVFIRNNTLGIVMRSLGLNPTDAQLADIVNEIGFNEKKTINLSDFLQNYSKYNHSTDLYFEYLERFQLYDNEGNGTLSPDVMKKILNPNPEYLDCPPDDKLFIDIDANGQIDYKKWVMTYMSNYELADVIHNSADLK